MANPIYVLNLLTKRQGSTLNYRLSQYVLSHKRCFSSKDDSSGEDKSQKQVSENKKSEQDVDTSVKSESFPKEDAKMTAKKKLFCLLSELKVDSASSIKSHPNLKLARAVKRPTKMERFKDVLEKQNKTPQDEIESAAKAVAESVRGDPKDTLAELNEKLRVLNLAKQPLQPVDMNEDSMKTSEDISQSLLEEEGNKNIMSSVEEVAAAVTDTPLDKNSLSQRLLRLSVESKSTATPRKSLDDLIKGMKMDRSRVETHKERRGQDEQLTSLQMKQTPRSFAQTKFNLFDAHHLDLPIEADTKIDAKETVWKRLERNQLKLLVQFAPSNAFEEMIMLTEQGKHWKLPIDNETEMGAEEAVGFHEHVFLEEHLHGFPSKGPVRHFMDLVVVGLSKNPYITVERKIENINWFRDYFKAKEEILEETGALG